MKKIKITYGVNDEFSTSGENVLSAISKQLFINQKSEKEQKDIFIKENIEMLRLVKSILDGKGYDVTRNLEADLCQFKEAFGKLTGYTTFELEEFERVFNELKKNVPNAQNIPSLKKNFEEADIFLKKLEESNFNITRVPVETGIKQTEIKEAPAVSKEFSNCCASMSFEMFGTDEAKAAKYLKSVINNVIDEMYSKPERAIVKIDIDYYREIYIIENGKLLMAA